MKKIRVLIFLLGTLFAACGGVTTETSPPPAPAVSPGEKKGADVSTDLNNPTGNTAVILGSNFIDPIGTLSLLPLNDPQKTTPNIQTTHSDAIVRAFNNKLYVVNRLGADNIQVVDPASDFQVTEQFSVGQGTNPQDIIVTNPSKAYVILYQPEGNRTQGLTVDDLLIVNPTTGQILKTIDLTPFTNDDGERFARASAMVIVNDKIFVALQDLPKNLVDPPNQRGKLVAVDTKTDSISGSLVLTGRNPIALNYSPETGKIYLADAYFFDLNTPYGGIEVVDPKTLTTEGIVIDDLALGGTPGNIKVKGTAGFTVLTSLDPKKGSVVLRFNIGSPGNPDITMLYTGHGYIQDIALDENGRLLVGDRDPAVNGILVIDPDTKSVIAGPINTGAAPSSITFVNR